MQCSLVTTSTIQRSSRHHSRLQYYMLCLMILMCVNVGYALPIRVTLNGAAMDVRWSDGDSFRVTSGRLRGSRARLMGYNTLESYGPVHKWGDWNEWELYRIAKDAKTLARSQQWECTAAEKKDHYGRLLVRCPRLTEEMVRSGYAHLFEIDREPDKNHLAVQQEAIKKRVGIWKKGKPLGILTSVHSIDENEDQSTTYNRFASPDTGRATKHLHTQRYATCEWVCVEGSCLLYVPFKQRYGDQRPSCLRWSPK